MSKPCKNHASPVGCTSGAKCRFSHGPQTSNTQATSKKEKQKGLLLCDNFASKAGCQYGGMCHFVHPCKNFSSSGGCKSGTDCRYAHLCKKFTSPTGCSFGTKCHFVHAMSQKQKSCSKVAVEHCRVAASVLENSPSAMVRHPCVAQYGKCAFGTSCRFANAPARSCLEYLRSRVCSKGGKCQWDHAGEDVDTFSSTTTDKSDDGDADTERSSSSSSSGANYPSEAAREIAGLRLQVVKAEKKASMVESRVVLEGLYRVASEFARGRGKPNPLPNPVALTSQAGVLFSKGLTQLGYSGISDLLDNPSHYTVGFHGTPSEDAICGIFQQGFDPLRRSGQVYGPGEYFDIGQGNVAASYQGTTDCLIVAIILTKDKSGQPLKQYTQANYNGGSPIAIVNNPLPLGEKGGGGGPPYAFNIPCAVASSQHLKSHIERKVREQFEDDFAQMQLHGTTTTTTTTTAAAAGGGNSSSSSGVPNGSGTKSLHFEGDSQGTWFRQADSMQQRAKMAEQSGTLAYSLTGIVVTTPDGQKSFDYDVDLQLMTQKNIDSQKVRRLKWM